MVRHRHPRVPQARRPHRRGERLDRLDAQIKPILSVESEITPVERVRTSRRAFERMVDYARQREASGANAWVVQHIQAHEQAEQLAEGCREVFGREPAFTSEIGPVLGVHTGPGLLGVGSIAGHYIA